MTTLTIKASQTISSTLPSSMPHRAESQQSVGVVIGSNTQSVLINTQPVILGRWVNTQSIGYVTGMIAQSVLIETRPVADERALKTQRLNKALQLGYLTPLIETSSKLK